MGNRMKVGEVWKCSEDSDLVFLVVEDYGKLRPMTLEGTWSKAFNMNTHIEYCPLIDSGLPIYTGCVKVSDSLHEYYLKKITDFQNSQKEPASMPDKPFHQRHAGLCPQCSYLGSSMSTKYGCADFYYCVTTGQFAAVHPNGVVWDLDLDSGMKSEYKFAKERAINKGLLRVDEPEDPKVRKFTLDFRLEQRIINSDLVVPEKSDLVGAARSESMGDFDMFFYEHDNSVYLVYLDQKTGNKSVTTLNVNHIDYRDKDCAIEWKTARYAAEQAGFKFKAA